MDLTSPVPHRARIVPGQSRHRPGWAQWLDGAFRRLLDFVAATLGLLFLAPFFLVIGLRIKRDSPGPVFFHGPRVGKDGRRFEILKFRTMYEQPESYNGPKITAGDDNRITPIGRWLRETKLNELPQLWNVFLGHMSLVGPRPEDPDFVDKWPADTRRELLAVRPGITSPASILYRDEESFLRTGNLIEDYLDVILPSKLRLDLIYVRHRSLLSDLDILFWTALALVPALKRRPISEHALYWGPLNRLVNSHFSWFIADFFVSLLAVAITGLIWRSGGPLDLGWDLAALVALIIAVIFSTVNAARRLHRVVWSKAPPSAIADLAIAAAIATTIVEFLNFLAGPTRLPFGLPLVAGLLSFGGFVLVRYRDRIVTGTATRWVTTRRVAPALGERVLIVGAGELGDFAAGLLRNSDLAQVYSVVGLVDDAPRKQGANILGLPVLGSTTDIPYLVERHDIGLLVYAIARIDPEERRQILALCHQTPAQVVQMPQVLTALNGFFQPVAANGHNGPGQAPGPHWAAWLEDLEAMLDTDDIAAARAEIRAMRRRVSVDEQ